MRLLNKSLFFILLLISVLYVAQSPPTPVDGGSGAGVGGTGAPSAPIDMYVYVLAFAALFIIVLCAKKYQKKII